MTAFSVIIPARYASTRLPGKPLANIAGKPMIQHVWEKAQLSGANRVIVATDNQEVSEAVKKFGGEVCMTSERHNSGTERLAEVVEKLSIAKDEIIVNIQGDEGIIKVDGPSSEVSNYRILTEDSLIEGNKNIKIHRMFSEFKKFIDVIDNKDFDFYIRQKNHSLAVMKILDEARKVL